MAVTQGIVNASTFGLYLDDTTPVLVTDQTELSIEFKEELRDTTTKDSGGWSESEEGLRSCDISSKGPLRLDSANQADELMTAFLGGTKLNGLVKTTNNDDPNWEFEGYVFELSFEAGMEANVDVDFTVGVDGPVTYS